MKKLFTIIFILLASVSFAAHPPPAQWSLAGVASWAQILTASGTAAPSDTAAFTIGDFYAQNTPGSSTVTLYRLCASGTGAIWNAITGSSASGGGEVSTASSLLDLTDLPAIAGNQFKVLALGTDTAEFYWQDAAGDLLLHKQAWENPHGQTQRIGATDFDINGLHSLRFIKNPGQTIYLGQAVIASLTESFSEEYYLLKAPSSSTQAIGIYNSAITYVADYDSATHDGMLVAVTGRVICAIASDSQAVHVGDWLITSDTDPGFLTRASSAGDAILSDGESQRKIGVAVTEPITYEDDMGLATYTWIMLKGNR